MKKTKKKTKKDTWGAEVGDAPWARHLIPAPGELRIVQALVNTSDSRTGTDELTGHHALGDWLARWSLVPAGTTKIGKADFERVIDVRHGLRALMLINRGGAPDEAAVARLDQVAASAMLRVRFGTRTTTFEPAGDGFPGALGRLVRIVAMARIDGLWPRLKLCADDSCGLAFYDTSPNRSGKWCSMSLCGGRSKAKTFRRRHPGYYSYA